MKRIYVPTTGALSWKPLLAQPDRQWKAGFSAMSVAQSWEAAAGKLPTEIGGLLERSPDPVFRRVELLIAIPEYQVDLPGGERPHRLMCLPWQATLRDSWRSRWKEKSTKPSARRLRLDAHKARSLALTTFTSCCSSIRSDCERSVPASASDGGSHRVGTALPRAGRGYGRSILQSRESLA